MALCSAYGAGIGQGGGGPGRPGDWIQIMQGLQNPGIHSIPPYLTPEKSQQNLKSLQSFHSQA